MVYERNKKRIIDLQKLNIEDPNIFCDLIWIDTYLEDLKGYVSTSIFIPVIAVIKSIGNVKSFKVKVSKYVRDDQFFECPVCHKKSFFECRHLDTAWFAALFGDPEHIGYHVKWITSKSIFSELRPFWTKNINGRVRLEYDNELGNNEDYIAIIRDKCWFIDDYENILYYDIGKYRKYMRYIKAIY